MLLYISSRCHTPSRHERLDFLLVCCEISDAVMRQVSVYSTSANQLPFPSTCLYLFVVESLERDFIVYFQLRKYGISCLGFFLSSESLYKTYTVSVTLGWSRVDMSILRLLYFIFKPSDGHVPTVGDNNVYRF